MMSRPIVIGTDFGESSLIAAQWTARQFGSRAELVLAHAIHVPAPPSFLKGFYPPTDHLVEEARHHAEVQFRELAAALKAPRVTFEVRVGRPDDVLWRVAEEQHAELLVVGPRRQHANIRQVLGSIAERVTRRARTSVLLARGLPAGAPRTVLVALDESPLARRAVAWAAQLAEQDVTRATAMHVVPPLLDGTAMRPSADVERRAVEETLRGRSDQWLSDQLAGTPLQDATVHTTFGDPGFELLAAVERLSADVLVVGRQGAGPQSGRFVGSVAEFVLREGTGPVLIVADGE